MSSFTKTVTEKQLAANQANGSLSHGPATPEGKAISSKNAMKHGLCARFFVLLPSENQEMFDDLFRQFVQDEKPVGSVETELVRRMAEYTWLRDRATRFMHACYDVSKATSEEIKAGKATIYVTDELERFLRHQAHFDRQFARASAELMKRRKERELQQIRFVSQQRAEAQEKRREKQENRREQVHVWRATSAQA